MVPKEVDSKMMKEKEFYSISDLFKAFSRKEEERRSASQLAQVVTGYQRGLMPDWSEEKVRQEIIKKQIQPMEESRKEAWKSVRAEKIMELVGCKEITNWHNLQNRETFGDIFPSVMADAIAISSYNASMGKIVAAPTGGSSGILPAAVLNVSDYMLQKGQIRQDEADKMMVDAMLVAAGIGILINEKATLSGAEGGCQAECGSAAGMAAGAIVTLKKGMARHVCNAAALALKNSLGLTCDPVKGYVLVPCIKRNAFYAVHAILAAEMAILGIESTIPFIPVINVMNETGKSMPEEFKETAKGGLAAIEEGKKLGESFEKELEKIFTV